jgi:hypothetical protein
LGSLDRATQWLAYRAASGYDPSSRSLRDRKEKEQEKGITKKGGRTTKKSKDVPPKRDHQRKREDVPQRKTRTYHQKGIAKKKLGSPQKLILTCYKQVAGKQTKESAGSQTNKRVRWQTNKRVRWQDVSHTEYGSSRVDKRFIPAS